MVESFKITYDDGLKEDIQTNQKIGLSTNTGNEALLEGGIRRWNFKTEKNSLLPLSKNQNLLIHSF